MNLKKLEQIFLSKDENELIENAWIFEGAYKYLDGEKINGEKIALNIFPRSGNAFITTYLQKIAGIELGFDLPVTSGLDLNLNGSKGFGVSDDTV